jgi:hypothetical protein
VSLLGEAASEAPEAVTDHIDNKRSESADIKKYWKMYVRLNLLNLFAAI